MTLMSQMCPPKAAFTEQSLPDLVGRASHSELAFLDMVYLVTGSNTGVGKELAQILYSRNATVYIAARSEEKANNAIASIRAACPSSTGSLEYLSLRLDDLAAVAQSARTFLGKSDRLDVLFCNAGIMHPPDGSITTQGYELQLGVNNLGHVLFAELLAPLLAKTASMLRDQGIDNGVRVVWVSSLYAETGSPKGGFDPENIDFSKKDMSKFYKYSVSKAGVYYQGVEYGRRHGHEGIISVTLNPGNLKSDLQRHGSRVVAKIGGLLLFPPINGAYTELFAGLSPEVNMEKAGSYIIPWGRFAKIRSDLAVGAIPTSQGGTGMSGKWYGWCLDQVREYMEDRI